MTTHHEDRREKNMQERIAIGLHPKAGSQSLADTRRILGTYTKAELIDFQIRAESDELKALDRAIAAEQSLRDFRADSYSIPKPAFAPVLPTGAVWDAYDRWIYPLKGRSLAVSTIFAAGWTASEEHLTATSTAETSN